MHPIERRNSHVTFLAILTTGLAGCSTPDTKATEADTDATPGAQAEVAVLDTAQSNGDSAAAEGTSDAPAAEGTSDSPAAEVGLDTAPETAPDTAPVPVSTTALDAGPMGGCKAGQFDAGGTCKAATCQSVGEYFTQAYVALVDSKQKCKTDAECAAVNMTTSCWPKCTIAVNPDAVAAIKQFVNDVEIAVCKPLDVANSCASAKIVPNCPPVSVGCVKGWCAADKPVETNDCPEPPLANAKCYSGKWVCNEGWIIAPDSKVCVALNCAALAEYVATASGADVAAADKACQKETDCHFVNTGTACGPGCPVAVAQQGMATEGKKNSDLDSFCKASAFPEKCPKLPAKACPPKTVSCKNGECALGGN